MLKRIVIKVGSRVLTNKDGSLNEDAIFMLAEDMIETAKENGLEVAVVSSGAVSAGRSIVDVSKFRLESEAIGYDKEILKEQILSSVGQPRVMSSWQKGLQKFSKNCSQILTTRRVFADRNDYLSIRTVTLNLMKMGVIPIFNENDTLSPEELDFTDNDQLACMVAAMIQADKLIILTDVDGVYTGSPNDPSSKLVGFIEDPEKYFSVVDKNSGKGKGGMETKLAMADQANSLGIDVHIANGLLSGVISKIVRGDQVGTHIAAQHKGKVRPIKYWLATAATSQGQIVVSTYLADLLRSGKAASVLFSGIENVVGEFKERDVIDVLDDEGKCLGRGIVRLSSQDLQKSLSRYRQTSSVEKAKSKANSMTAIHYNDFARC